jgi:hypothetical protein
MESGISAFFHRAGLKPDPGLKNIEKALTGWIIIAGFSRNVFASTFLPRGWYLSHPL